MRPVVTHLPELPATANEGFKNKIISVTAWYKVIKNPEELILIISFKLKEKWRLLKNCIFNNFSKK